MIPSFFSFREKIFENLTSPVKLNTKVTGINYLGETVRVQTTKGAYWAKKVICTIPLGVLQANVVQFPPQLPKAVKNSINKFGFGAFDKLYVKVS